jgi:hypothetical protein
MRVYIAGPYTKGDVAVNVRNAILAADAVHALGMQPFIPHMTHFWHMLCPKPYEEWLAIDMVWLKCCNVVLRLPGESSGADKEVRAAEKLGIPVFHSIEELKDAR